MDIIFLRNAPAGGRPAPGVKRLRARFSIAGICILAGLSACGYSSNDSDTLKVNGSIHVAAGKPSSAVATVNGSISVDEGAAITTAETVNGAVLLGAHATAASLQTVNGSITLNPDAQVAGSAEAVNGTMRLLDGAQVTGRLSNVNGDIELRAAHVAGGIRTVSGNISVSGNSRVEGGILVEKPSGGLFHFGNGVPRIVIGPGAVVQGELRFEREVKLYVSDHATVGPVSGATAISFSGDQPPA